MTETASAATSPEAAGELPDPENGSEATVSDDATSSPELTEDTVETGSEAAEPDDPKADREAAKYRRQLRDTQAERDRLATQVEGYHRAEVERLAAARLIDARDIWAGGLQLADVLNDGGQVDPARVAQAVADLAATRPHWCHQAAAPASTVGSAGKPDTASDQPRATWGSVLSQARNGSPDDD